MVSMDLKTTMAAKIVEDRDGVVVQLIDTGKILRRYAKVRTAEVFCAVRDIPILEERVIL